MRLPWRSRAAQRGAGCFARVARGSRIKRKARSGREKNGHKDIGLPPCKMAAFKHLSGGGDPGQRAEGCPRSARWPEIGTWGDSVGESGPQARSSPGQPSAFQPARLPQTLRRLPPDTDPCLQTQPRGGVGRPGRGLAGRERTLAPEDATSSEERGVGVREPARQLERTERLVFETVNSLNPYCEGFMQNISGLLK